MYRILGKPRSIASLPSLEIDISEARKAQRILIIDDNYATFELGKTFTKFGYYVREVEDLSDWESVKAYTILVVDINGVGKQLGLKDGAALINQVNRISPMLPVVAFSANDHRLNLLSGCKVAAILKKDLDIEEWIKKLDEISTSQSNPIVQWKTTRNTLLDRGFPLTDLIRLEDKFVQEVSKRKDISGFRDFIDSNSLKFDEGNKKILISLCEIAAKTYAAWRAING